MVGKTNFQYLTHPNLIDGWQMEEGRVSVPVFFLYFESQTVTSGVVWWVKQTFSTHPNLMDGLAYMEEGWVSPPVFFLYC